jgi:uncharacterized protein (DUF736 family)
LAYEMKYMSGSLFKNDRKETDTHPDYKGSALINGVEHWLDAWINTAKDGSKYMSLKMKPKEARGLPATNEHAGYTPPNTTAMIDLDDDVPF